MQIIFLFFYFFIGSTLFAIEVARNYQIDNNFSTTYKLLIQEEIQKIGFTLYEPHPNIDQAYEEQFANSDANEYDKEYERTLDVLDFYPMANDLMLSKTLQTIPKLGAFFPFNFHVYKKSADKNGFIGHISHEYITDILGLDIEQNNELIALFEPLETLLEHHSTSVRIQNSTTNAQKLKMYNFIIDLKESSDSVEVIEDLQEKLEDLLDAHGFIITGYEDLKERFEDQDIEFNGFDTYSVYSFCHFSFSYYIFNKGRPDIGVLAPCNIYIYKQNDSNKIMIGISRISNWKNSMDIKDQNMLDSIDRLDQEIVSILEKLGGYRDEK